jgi:hypothetical protein
MNWALAIGFELGAAASLAAIIILDKTNKTMVWTLFLLLTAFQMMANSFHAFINLENYMPWIELFGLEEEEPIFQKRILSIVSGAVLPIVALGFIKSLVDYIRPEKTEETATAVIENKPAEVPTEPQIETPKVVEEKVETPSVIGDSKVGHVTINPEVTETKEDVVATKQQIPPVKNYNPKP